MTFYTYLWLREDGTPYYVGKGCHDRAYEKHGHLNRPSRDRIIVQQYASEEDAFRAEQLLISFYGRRDLGKGRLCNRTDGGEGQHGAIRTDATRKKLSESHKGIALSAAARKKVSDFQRGRIKSLETRQKLSASLKGKPNGWTGKTLSEEHKINIREAKKGRPQSREHIAALIKVRLGSKRSPETRLRMSLSAKANFAAGKNCPPSNQGRKLSEETKQKISIAHLLRVHHSDGRGTCGPQ